MALTISDAIQAVINQASALSPAASAENLVYLAKSLEAISDGTLPANDAMQAIINRAQTLSPASSAEDLVYLAKSIQALATGATLADVVNAGTTAVGNVNTAGTTKVGAVNTAGTTQVEAVTAEGTTQLGLVTAKGTQQTGLVNTAGGTQVDAVNAAGDTQNNRVIAQGDTQVGRINDAGNGFVTLTATQTLSNKTVAGLKETKIAMPAGAMDLAQGNFFTKTITAATTFTLSNIPAAGSAVAGILDLTNGGAFACTFTGWKWVGGTAPTFTTSGRDVIGFFIHDGATITGLVLGKDVK